MTISEQFVPNRELPKNLSGIKMSSDHLIDSSSHEALMRSEQVSQSFKPQIANLVDSMIGRVEGLEIQDISELSPVQLAAIERGLAMAA